MIYYVLLSLINCYVLLPRLMPTPLKASKLLAWLWLPPTSSHKNLLSPMFKALPPTRPLSPENPDMHWSVYSEHCCHSLGALDGFSHPLGFVSEMPSLCGLLRTLPLPTVEPHHLSYFSPSQHTVCDCHPCDHLVMMLLRHQAKLNKSKGQTY